ncbi:hypothetical protein Tco_0206432 [Tanacetum coccineum]
MRNSSASELGIEHERLLNILLGNPSPNHKHRQQTTEKRRGWAPQHLKHIELENRKKEDKHGELPTNRLFFDYKESQARLDSLNEFVLRESWKSWITNVGVSPTIASLSSPCRLASSRKLDHEAPAKIIELKAFDDRAAVSASVIRLASSKENRSEMLLNPLP